VEKIWFIIIAGKKEGPYSFLDLKRDVRITPDTLIWKEGFATWRPIREVKELEELFKDEPSTEEEEKQEEENPPSALSDNEVLTLKKDPYFNIWIVVALFLVIYLCYLLLR
jgi:uncharacterized protein DUF4339